MGVNNCVHVLVAMPLDMHIRTSVRLPCVSTHTRLRRHTVRAHRHLWALLVCQCVYACTMGTSIMQSRELQSVKSTLTFMVLTSQGHPKAEHLEWSVTFQTENNSRVFSSL